MWHPAGVGFTEPPPGGVRLSATAPTIRERLASWLAPARAATPPIDFEPLAGQTFGPALANQPAHEVLLRESLGVVDTATRAIANRVSSLDPLVKRSMRDGAGSLVDETVDDHPLKLLLDRPHPNLTRRQLLRLTTQYIVTVGEAYWLKVGAQGDGLPVELHPMPPADVHPIVRQGVVEAYVVRDGNGLEDELPPDVVCRFFFPDPESPWRSEGYFGPSAVTSDSRKFAGEHLRRHYQHNATPKSALEPIEGATPGFTPEEAKRFRTLWNQLYSTRDGTAAGAPAIIPPSYKLIELAMQTGSEITPLLEHWRDDLLMAFGVPRSVLGQVVSGDRSSAETNQFVFDLHTILPIAQMIEDGITLQIASDFEGEVFCRFDEFVSSDKRFELERETADLVNKVRSINDVREDRTLAPAEWGELPVGKVGESPYTGEELSFGMPPGLPPAGLPEDEPPEMLDDGELEPEGDEPRQRSAEQWARALWQRQVADEKHFIPSFFNAQAALLTQQKRAVLKQLRDRFPSARISADEVFAPEQWAELYERRLEPLRVAAYVAALEGTLAEFGLTEFEFTAAARNALRREGAQQVSWTLASTRRQLIAALDNSLAEGEGVEAAATRIRKVFSVRRKQALTTARTEILKARTLATLEGFKLAGVKAHRWHTSMDDAVRDTHIPMEGVAVQVGQPFTLERAEGGIEYAEGPRQGYNGSRLSAGNTINCRCFLTPEPGG